MTSDVKFDKKDTERRGRQIPINYSDFEYLSFKTVGMVKQPAMESSEFQMSNEDFPALPGSAPAGANSNQQGGGGGGGGQGNIMDPGLVGNNGQGQGSGGNDRMTSQGLHQDNSNLGVGTAVSQAVAQEGSTLARRGIQTSPDGKGMLKDHLNTCSFPEKECFQERKELLDRIIQIAFYTISVDSFSFQAQ